MLLLFSCKDNEQYGSNRRNQPDHNELYGCPCLGNEGKDRPQ